MPTNPKRIFKEAKYDANVMPPGERLHKHTVVHVDPTGKKTEVGTVEAHYSDEMYGEPSDNTSLQFKAKPEFTAKGTSGVHTFPWHLGGVDAVDQSTVAKSIEKYFGTPNKKLPAAITRLQSSGTFKAVPHEPELPGLKAPHHEPRMQESVKDLFKLALEEKPNAFREVFDEIMLAKIVDISDEMKNEIAQSMFGESSHKNYDNGRRKHKNPNNGEKMEESFEPEEDEDEYEDVGDEDEDFDISDEDLEDLDLDDLDFEDEEDEISESVMKGIAMGKRPTTEILLRQERLSPEELAELEAEMKAKALRLAAARERAVDRLVGGTHKVKNQIAAMKARLGQGGLTFPQDEK